MKTWYQKLLAKFQLWLTKHNFQGEFVRGIAGKLFDVRAKQAVIAGLTTVVAWFGDSRWMEVELQVDAVPGWWNASIGGTKVNDYQLQGMRLISALRMIPGKLKAIVDDLGGNDFIGGASTEEVLTAKRKLRAMYKTVIPVVITSEICLLGPEASIICPNWKEVNLKIIAYNETMAAEIGAEFVRVNDVLSPSGFMAPEYDCGDGVHHTLAAYDIYFPRIKAALKAVAGLEFP